MKIFIKEPAMTMTYDLYHDLEGLPDLSGEQVRFGMGFHVVGYDL